MMIPRILFGIPLLAASAVDAAVTVYTSATGSAAMAQYTVASTDQTFLNPPAPPADFNPATFIQLYDGGMTGMGQPTVRVVYVCLWRASSCQVLRKRDLLAGFTVWLFHRVVRRGNA